jgi:cytochrome c oxidase cbb3-type subunit 1
VGHVHVGALGWVAMITFGSFYALVPWMWKRPALYSAKLVEVHFWLALAGTVVYIFAMWNSGIIQGLMWRTFDPNGTLAYSFLDTLVAMHPYYIARAFGGLLFLAGAVVAFYNIWMTITQPAPVDEGAATDLPVEPPAPRAWAQAGE